MMLYQCQGYEEWKEKRFRAFTASPSTRYQNERNHSVEVPRTPLPPLPKLGEVTRGNISNPVLSDDELDALKYSRIREQDKRGI